MEHPMTQPRITFGIIVLNGEPFLRYNLRTLYPYAHQIVIAEGASPRATHAATPDGHSLDHTLETIRRFQAEEDPEGKVLLVTAEDEGHPNGFWPGEKDEQSQAYAKRATGDWLWQIDIDEFYHPADIERVRAYLAAHPDTTCLTFRAHHFWGGFDYTVDGGLYRHPRHQGELWGVYRRLLKWGPGYQYITHRPPSVADATGRDITRRRMRCISDQGVMMYHYVMLFPEQFTRKGAYYEKQPWAWERNRLEKNKAVLEEVNLANGLRIMDHHGTRNWLSRFRGSHPAQIAQLREDIRAGRVPATLRRTDDIERLLADPHYRALVRRAARGEYLRTTLTNLARIVWWQPRAALGAALRTRTPAWARALLPAALRARLDRSVRSM
jgi:hypothetical protein